MGKKSLISHARADVSSNVKTGGEWRVANPGNYPNPGTILNNLYVSLALHRKVQGLRRKYNIIIRILQINVLFFVLFYSVLKVVIRLWNIGD